MLGVSDKAVSKWERGCGAPDISLLPLLSQALGVDTEVLLRGELEENAMSSGNLNKLKFYLCPDCANLLFSTDDADVHCCGKKLSPMAAKKAEGADALSVTVNRLRGKLEDTPSSPEYLKTVYGIGYTWAVK